MVTETDVRAVLDQMIHPSFGMSLIALDMVRAVRVNDTIIEVDLVMNCPGCPAGETVLAGAFRALQALDQTKRVKLIVLPHIWSSSWI